MYNFSFLHAPRPCRSACSGFSSPCLGRQRSPRVHGPVYTPHAWPSSSAHVRQQPQPGSFTSWQPTGTGGHMDRAFWSHGWHGTKDAPPPRRQSSGSSSSGSSSGESRSSIAARLGKTTETATVIDRSPMPIFRLRPARVRTSGVAVPHPQVWRSAAECHRSRRFFSRFSASSSAAAIQQRKEKGKKKKYIYIYIYMSISEQRVCLPSVMPGATKAQRPLQWPPPRLLSATRFASEMYNLWL